MPAASIRDATRDVWANNLEDEMRILRRLIDDFPLVSMVRVASPGLGVLPSPHEIAWFQNRTVNFQL
jgi:hypothetical protein